KFPLWLAPVQVYVLPITNAFDGYATEVLRHLRSAGFRADGDFRNEKIGYKIRELSHQKIPVLFVVGQKEMESGTVALRQLGQTNQEVLELGQAIELLKERVESLR
ncbi:MAG: threonine--tRNA ligase, partial [Holosporales bacterium]|nr:threonine--tRNA ligase [Holosporales bacterium]